MLNVLGTQFEFLNRSPTMSLWTGTAISVVVTAAWAVGATRWTRELRIT